MLRRYPLIPRLCQVHPGCFVQQACHGDLQVPPFMTRKGLCRLVFE
jgi:hypothetical protein